MMKKQFYLGCLCLLLMGFQSMVYAEKIKVTFINPGTSSAKHGTGSFWLNVSNFMQAAAEDLNIQLKILYAERKHTKLPKLAKEACDANIDYVVMVNEMRAADRMLRNCKNVPTFFILNTLLPDQIKRNGFPREREKDHRWFGSLVPDNYFAGYTIADYLFRDALSHQKSTTGVPVQVLGIAGDRVTPAAIERNNGLVQAVKDNPQIELKQIALGKWNKDVSQQVMVKALKRYPDIGAVWAANDPMALGAMQGLQSQGKVLGKDIFIGGLNWDPPALQEIQQGRMTVSLGGHFMTGGWAMIVLYDHFHGIDFGTEKNNFILKHKIFDVIHRENVDNYISKFGDQDWSKIDFRKFSKKLNRKLQNYDFSLSAIFRQG